MFDYSELKYNENEQLWAAIDKVNNALLVSKQYINDDILEETFKEAIEISTGIEISDEFERLRTEAFETDDYSVIDKYAQRCSPAITVAIMGESNNIGINVDIFIEKCRLTTAPYKFLKLAKNGFYPELDLKIRAEFNKKQLSSD